MQCLDLDIDASYIRCYTQSLYVFMIDRCLLAPISSSFYFVSLLLELIKQKEINKYPTYCYHRYTRAVAHNAHRYTDNPQYHCKRTHGSQPQLHLMQFTFPLSHLHADRDSILLPPWYPDWYLYL